MRSIMVTEDEYDRCYRCGSYRWIEMHHIFGGANRKNSDKYGLIVPLCHYCHNEPPDGVHFNRENMLKLQAEAQGVFESIESHEKFMDVFGEDYIEAYKYYMEQKEKKWKDG